MKLLLLNWSGNTRNIVIAVTVEATPYIVLKTTPNCVLRCPHFASVRCSTFVYGSVRFLSYSLLVLYPFNCMSFWINIHSRREKAAHDPFSHCILAHLMPYTQYVYNSWCDQEKKGCYIRYMQQCDLLYSWALW